MKSKTKQSISPNVVAEIFARHSLGSIAKIEQLKGGNFNALYKVKTESGKQYALKIAPKANVPVLTYEQNLIKSEVTFSQLLSQVQRVKFPEIFGFNWEEDYPYKYLIMEFLEGEILSNIKLPKSEYDEVMFDLGAAMAEFHTITSTQGFGYPQNGLKPTWQEAYFSMIQNVLKDGEKKKVKVPYLSRIINIMEENADVLLTVKTPSLLHFDLWAGNIMIKKGKLYGLIDCERAIFGDIMGDFISLDYISPFSKEKNKMLIDGYNSVSKEKLTFGKEEMLRLYLMKIYLSLVVLIEPHYRFSKLSSTFYGSKAFGKTMIENTIKEIERIMGCA